MMLRSALLLATLAAPLMPLQAQHHQAHCSDFVERHCGARAPDACFAADGDWQAVPEACVGDVQTMVEMAREAREQARDEAALDADGLVDTLDRRYARSYGGVLRQGPSTSRPRLASLAEGEKIRLLAPDAMWEGYRWYRVMTTHGEGYHWGGLFCSEGPEPLDGVLTACGSEHEATLFGSAAE